MDAVVHFEMPYENTDRLIEFYSQVFSWQMQKQGQEMGEETRVASTVSFASHRCR